MVTVISLKDVKSPFKAVAEYPPALPYIGQDSAYYRLEDFAQAMRTEEQSHFFALYGAWAIGKSRLAHELVAQFCGESQGWTLTNGQRAEPLLTPLMQGGQVVPLFVSFVDVLNFQQYEIDPDTAMGKLVCAAAAYLAGNKGRDSHFHLYQALRAALTAVNPNFDFDRLVEIASDRSRGYAERSGLIVDALREMTNGRAQRVLVMVDEVESGGDVNPFAEELDKEITSRPIKPRAVRDLYTGVKDASNTNAYPRLNFLFFNTDTAKRLAYMEALERRMVSADLEKASATDLDRLIEALRESGYPLYGMLEDLARRAFFAADRNFGWFSFIMNKAHRALVNTPDLSVDQVFAEVYSRTGKVFQPGVFEDRDIAPPALKDAMRRVIYNQLPTTLAELGIAPSLRRAMLDYQDPFQTRFIGEAVAVATSADRLTSALLETGRYISEEQPTLTGESSVRFDPATILDSLRTFAWPGEGDRLRLWIYADPSEFENQVSFAYRGFGENFSAESARTIHRILLERCRITEATHDESGLVAPTMALLRRFNDLWGKAAANDWLPEAEWERVIKKIDSSPEQNDRRLLQGIANVLFDAPQPQPDPYSDVKGQSLILKLESHERFNVTSRNQLVLLKARQTPVSIVDDLRAIGQRTLILLIFDHPSLIDEWERYLNESQERHLLTPVIAYAVEPQTRAWEFYVRYALRDAQDGFKSADVRQRGKDLRDEFRNALHDRFTQWLAAAEQQGYVLRPFYPAKNASTPAFKDFARGWATLLRAGSLGALGAEAVATQKSLEEYEREQKDYTLTLTADDGEACHACIPAVVPHLLAILQAQPRKLPDLADAVFFVRGPSTVTFPTVATAAVEQLLLLLQEIGVVEFDTSNRYVVRTAASFNLKFDQSFQRLGSQEGALSGYSKQVADLSDPVKALATQLSVNKDQLILLKSQKLAPEKERMSKLPLDRLTTLPADQEAYTEVARSIGAVSAALDEVLGKSGPGVTPPEIDPHTLQDNITHIGDDKGYHEYPIEYRVTFLQRLDDYLAQSERDLRARLAAVRGSLAQSGDASAFPTRPLQSLLDAVQGDLNDTLPGNALPNQLRQRPQDAALKVLKGAGKLSDVLLKLDWYTRQLDEQNADGWWVRYTTAREQWKAVRADYEQVEATWNNLERYFAGTAPEHAILYMGPGLERDKQELDEKVASFSERQSASNVSLDELNTEIEGIRADCAALAERMSAARSAADSEIVQQLEVSNDQAVGHLAERLRYAHNRPDPQRVRTARTHQEAHAALDRYVGEVRTLGVTLCQRPELYEVYLRIYSDRNRQGMTGEQIFGRYDEKILREMSDRNLITLRNTVDV